MLQPEPGRRAWGKKGERVDSGVFFFLNKAPCLRITSARRPWIVSQLCFSGDAYLSPPLSALRKRLGDHNSALEENKERAETQRTPHPCIRLTCPRRRNRLELCFCCACLKRQAAASECINPPPPLKNRFAFHMQLDTALLSGGRASTVASAKAGSPPMHHIS